MTYRLWTGRWGWAVRAVLVAILALGAIGMVVAAIAGTEVWREAARAEAELEIDPGPRSTLVYDTHDRLTFALFREHRMVVPLERMSPTLIGAVLAAEDQRFFEHGGVDYRRIVGAAVANMRAGRVVQGASTITQQLVRDLVLDRRRTWRRKMTEAILARRLEQRMGKRAILEAYLNRVYLGDGYYGVEAAARGYFGKSAANVTPAEAAMLAAVIKGPSIYSPATAPERARVRRDWVLDRMHTLALLDEPQLQQALAEPVLVAPGDEARTAVDPRRHGPGAYFNDLVRRELVARFGEERVMTGGLRVYTTLDPALQAAAEQSVRERLAKVPGADRGAEPLQGALVALDPATGAVRALVGGRDFLESPFNRAVDARRQPGSAFKPFVYARAIEDGLTPASWLNGLDEPIMSAEGPWLPDGEHEVDRISLQQALVVSSNRAAAHLITEVGIRPTLDLVRQFGIESPQPPVPSVALGTGGLTLLELTSAYGVFANKGAWTAPHVIRRVEDALGQVVWAPELTPRHVLSEGAAYIMTSMLANVVDHGTGITARYEGFRRPAAGKTGTSDDYADAWFVGYTPRLVTGVWFGYDHPRPIMHRGFASVVAVPAWAHFMSAATQGSPVDRFERPDSVVPVQLCRLTGLRATAGCEHQQSWTSIALSMDPLSPDGPTVGVVPDSGVVEDIAIEGHLPPPCPVHGGLGTADTTAVLSMATPGAAIGVSRAQQ
ncbi:MAG: transglycosylase domain-containing protein [Vicinamibacterales bacterium]